MSEISEKGDWFPFSNNLTLSPDGVGQTEGESHPNKLKMAEIRNGDFI